jgi:outer membrane protein assembly factor BamB/tRNA A-37 threonylcarbamoyl transferase component Bud32
MTDLRTVGEFRLLARLGSGGMGQVFLASSLAGRIVAVKVIHPELCKDEEFIQRFRNEAEAAARVSGWYTAPVVAVGVNDKPPWLATAFVSGPSLDDIVTRCGPLPLPAVWRLAAGLAEALRAIHAAGLVHRDLKPANVLMALDGPRVIDFGIARAVTDTRLTATGAIIGTLSFMSPEQAQAEVTGPASDIFSLGSVLAFAASGSAPFSGGPGASSASVLYRIVHGEPDLRAVPADVQGLLEACLAKDPRQRPDLARVAAYSTAAAERLGLSPAAFWPHEVAGVIEAQQAALTAQIEALQLASATHVEGAWRGNGMATDPAYREVVPAPTWPPVAVGGTAASGQAAPGQLGALRGMSRRGLLVGAGVGSVVVAGGAVGLVLSSRSAPGAPSSPQTGHVPPVTGQPSGAGQSLRRYYGVGTPRNAVWKFPTGNAINANPGAANGVAYIVSTDNNLYAINSATGRQAWSHSIGSATAAPGAVGDVVCLSTSEGHFYALHAASGALAWDLDTQVPATYRRTWAVDGGSVILPGETVPPQAYDAVTGTRGVSFRTREPYVLALRAAGGFLYALDALGALYAFHAATGTRIWRKPLLSTDDPSITGLTVGDGNIYLGTKSGTLYAIRVASGRVHWTYRPGSGMDSELTVAGGVVYVKDAGTLHAISGATGKRIWARAATDTGLFGPTVAGGRVYYSTALAIQALDARSGAPVWSFASAGAEFLTTPAVAGGLVFAGSSDDSLYAIQA